MLCPGCGTNVGEKLQYCENCKALNQVKEVKAVNEEKVEPENQVDEVSLQEILEEGNNPSIKIIEKLFFSLAFIAVVLAIFTIIYYRKDSSPKSALPEISEIAHDPSFYTFTGKKIDLLSNIAVYDSKNQFLEIAFFDGNLSELNKDLLKSLDSLVNIPNAKPDVVLSFKFNNPKDCNMANVSQAKVLLIGLDPASALTTIPLEFNSNFDPNSATAFGTLNCNFQEKEILNGQFKISLKLQKEAEGNNLNLDLKTKVKLLLK